MTGWSAGDLGVLAAAEEIQVVTLGPDGTSSRPVTTWVVTAADRVFVRSTNGPTAAWFRRAQARGAGRLMARDSLYAVRFREAAEADLPTVDAAYRSKYGRYASIVEHLIGPGPRGATLEVLPD